MECAEEENEQGSTCLGTKVIDLVTEAESTKTEGLVTVLHAGEMLLSLVVTDGQAIYKGTISIQDVKMKYLGEIDESKKAEFFSGYLLDKTNSDSSVTASYSYSTCGDTSDEGANSSSIKVVIKYHNAKKADDEDAAMKKAWSGTLQKQASSSTGKDLLSFYKTLGKGVNMGQRRIKQLQEQMKKLQDDRESWKNTAEKLEGGWSKEKNELLQNFVMLYNKTREELGKTRSELETLRKQQASSREDQESTNRASRRPKVKQEQENQDIVHNQPDDLDDNIFGNDMVDALANAKPVSLKKANNNTKKSRTASRSSTSERPAKKAKVKKAPKVEVKQEPESDHDDKKESVAAVKKEPQSDSDDSDTRNARKMILAAADSSSDEEDGRRGVL